MNIRTILCPLTPFLCDGFAVNINKLNYKKVLHDNTC